MYCGNRPALDFNAEPNPQNALPCTTCAVFDSPRVPSAARIPVDGDVVGGNSFVDQATITGESLPVEKVPGTSVFAGTVNQSGATRGHSDGGIVKTCGLACHDEVVRSVAGRGRSCRSDQEPSLTVRSGVGTQRVTNG